ncbi:AAA family ATPase, putative [Plasmodium malariae]|uniref:AAA family ATPase, putative n=1 Tax=Plasmodium malariae TaxID=5858 RepID=A0A1C3KL40_PLAMA|nr:AAA family ATPase, putative [Plasmodium malariae]
MGSGPPSGNKYGYTDEKVGDHITGNFDPTALERGAKALKELDQSSNSKKAFELIKLQELTKQKEYEKQMEELSLQRAQYLSNKTRIERDKAHHKVANIKSGSGSGSNSSSNMFDQIVLNEELQEKLTWSINSLRNSKKYDLYLKNILLHGPPGTGKTLFAKTVSYYSNFDYIIINGGDVSALGIHASVELNKIFEFVKKRKNKKCIIFIDEAEAFLRKGRNESFINFSEHLRNALASFLYHTGTESKNFGVILATNCRDILDPAVMDRIDEQYNFDIPQISEIKKMVSLYFNKYVFPLKKYNIIIDDSVDDNYLDDIARRLYGLSGRQISKLCLNIQNTVLRQYEKQSEMRNEQYETHNNTQISSYNPRQNSGSHNTANSNSRKMENKVVLNHVL